MARLARVIPNHPHHVTQRGNGRERTFFGDHNYKLYRDLLAENCRAARVEVSSYGDSALIRGAAAFEVTARMAVHAR
jgi:hypothetical protein